MKKFYKLLLLFAVLFTSPLVSMAYDFEVDGIYYNITDATTLTVEVTFSGDSYSSMSGEYSGEVIIPETVTYSDTVYNVSAIGNNAFRGCAYLRNPQIPTSVTSIGDNAFHGCTRLTSINIPQSIISIGKYAFYNCTGLTSVNIPQSVISIGNFAFRYCNGLSSITVDSKNTVYDSRDNCNAIIESATNTLIKGCKNSIIPQTTTVIGDYAFEKCIDLTTINIPESVTSIGEGSFFECTGLTGAIYTASVETIGWSAFQSCRNLTSLNISESVTYIDSSAFSDCTNLESIIIDTNNTTYDSRDNCNAIIETATNTLIQGCNNSTIAQTITIIGDGAFSSYANLTQISIPESVISIGRDAFYGTGWYCNQPDGILYLDNCCLGYKGSSPTGELAIKDDTRIIAAYSFNYCSELTSVTFPESVKSIGYDAFRGCTGLSSVVIPPLVTSIEDRVFYSCTGLTSVIIHDSITSIGSGAFRSCSSLTEFTIPTSVISIGTDAFLSSGWYNNQADVVLYKDNCCVGYKGAKPSGELSINPDTRLICINALRFCTGLTSVILPASVNIINNYAFNGCSNLLSMTTQNPVPPTCGTNVFDYIPTDCTLHVPAGSKEAYANDPIWSYFTDIVEFATVEVSTQENNATFEIPTVENAIAYTVNVYTDEAMTQLVATANYDASGAIIPMSTSLNLSISGLENGTYYYNVIAKSSTDEEVSSFTGSFEINSSTGIHVIANSNEVVETARYDINGRLLSEPVEGFNIVVYSDGTTRKEFVK